MRGSTAERRAYGERLIALVAAAVLTMSVVVAASRAGENDSAVTAAPPSATLSEPLASETPQPRGTEPSELVSPLVEGELEFHDPSETDSSGPPPAARPATASTSSWFASRYPSHDAAIESPEDPATSRWAVIVGVNDHIGSTRDNLGSRQDAEELAAHLTSLGWRSDHVLLLTDATATRQHMLEGFAWLARKTSDDSVVVIHYSGHVKQWYGWDVDNDGETTDEALWPSDNQFITDSEFSSRVATIRAERLWVDIGGCEAAGFADAPIVRSGGVYTFSSEEDEKSYEDPSKSNSVWGWYLVDRALVQGYGDGDHDGDVTVEEAFAYAGQRATDRTTHQARGPQHPVMIDRLAGDFSLSIPDPPAPPPAPAPPDPDPADDPTDGGGGGILAPPPDEDDDCVLLFC